MIQWARKLLGRGRSEAASINLDPLTSAAFNLVGYISLTTGSCADAILDKWPTLTGKIAAPPVSYSVYAQFMFLYLHVMDRLAFAKGGDERRIEVRDLVTPLLLPALNGYLSGRHDSSGRVQSSDMIDAVSHDFFQMLDRSEYSFSRVPDYASMMAEVARRICEAWEIGDSDALGLMVRQEAGTRGHNLESLLSEVTCQLEAYDRRGTIE